MTTQTNYTASSFTATGVSDPMLAREGHTLAISVSGTFAATVTLQRRFGADETTDPEFGWRAWKTYTTLTEASLLVDHDCQVRLNCNPFTSGPAVAEIRQSRERWA